jgi:hypothetical protein
MTGKDTDRQQQEPKAKLREGHRDAQMLDAAARENGYGRWMQAKILGRQALNWSTAATQNWGSRRRQNWKVLWDWLDTVITRTRVIRFVSTVVLIAVPSVIFYLSWNISGPISTIVYSILFLLCFGLAPILIGIFGQTVPGAGSLGKAHFVLGQFAAGTGWLVQLDDRYEMCPGDREKFWYDGDWYEVPEGQTNLTVLGWKPFGMTWFKTDDDLREARVDPRGVTDGGMQTVQRGGVRGAEPNIQQDFECVACEKPVEVGMEHCPSCGVPIDAGSEIDAATSSQIQRFQPDTWLVSLHRLYRTGLGRIGNTDLIETAEEQTMLDEVGSGTVSEWSTVIGGIIGVTLGIVAGYVGLFM